MSPNDREVVVEAVGGVPVVGVDEDVALEKAVLRLAVGSSDCSLSLPNYS